MATLISPGVSISVSDESFYAAAGAGSVPLIVIATAQDKISREKEADKKKHDRILDRARLARARTKNRETK